MAYGFSFPKIVVNTAAVILVNHSSTMVVIGGGTCAMIMFAVSETRGLNGSGVCIIFYSNSKLVYRDLFLSTIEYHAID